MTRDQTQIFKGVAIILMLFLHLFNYTANVDLCHNIFLINGKPLVSYLVGAANPVAFFLILGGYGMYKVWEKGDRHRWTRVFKLYLHYWIILAIFLIIGHFLNPDLYPGSISDLLSNITTYSTTYNGEMWFLLPYVCLSLLAPMLFKAVRHVRAWKVVAVTLFIHLCTSFCISRYGTSFLFHNLWAYNPLLICHLMFNFSLGAMAARSNFFERLSNKAYALGRWRSRIAVLGVIIFVLISCMFKYNYFYAFIVITLLTLVRMPQWLMFMLAGLGKQSMNMWMIHTWFCYYLFREFIYSFEYPIVILMVLIAVSYVTSIIINLIAVPIERRILTRSEMKEKIAI